MKKIDQVPNSYRDFKKAAVMILIDEKNRVLFTKRTDQLRTHRGQISFPGGKLDKEDKSLKDAALRETYEEIGLNPHKIFNIIELRPSYSPLGFIIYPFIGRIMGKLDFFLSAGEVERVIRVPFDFFCKQSPYRRYYIMAKERIRADFYVFGPHLIWGATARILTSFIENGSLKNIL